MMPELTRRRDPNIPLGMAIVDVLPSPNHNHEENDQGRDTGDGCWS